MCCVQVEGVGVVPSVLCAGGGCESSAKCAVCRWRVWE